MVAFLYRLWRNLPIHIRRLILKTIVKKHKQKRLLIIAVVFSIFAFSVADAEQHLYWSDLAGGSKGIYKANIDGTSPAQIVALNATESAVQIAIDDVSEKIFWADNNLGMLQCADIDGTNKATIVSNATAIKSIVVDSVNQKVYWADNNGINRSNVDGTGVQNVYTPTGGLKVNAIDLDVGSQKLAWTESFSNSNPYIYRLDLSTSSTPVFITSDTFINSVLINTSLSRVFWMNSSPSTNVFLNYINDGESTNRTLLDFVRTGVTSQMALSADSGQVFIADTANSAITRVTIATGASSTVAGVANPYGIALDCGRYAQDLDNDGYKDDRTKLICGDACPGDSTKQAPGTCGCGVADADTDSDGTLNCQESCPNDPLKLTAGACGCGVVDDDSDLDGTLDCEDQCPDDARKTENDTCACGLIEEEDEDGKVQCVATRCNINL
jgi:hypothetical protein